MIGHDSRAEATIDTVCLFCGASQGTDDRYARAVETFVRELAERDITLVTGGGGTGLMGVAADAMLDAGGRVIGIIPERLRQREVAHQGMTELRVVKSMHERKAMMAELSDAFVTAPGGIGTLEELFEVFTWRQLGYHDKPVAMLNAGGYYDTLLRFIDEAVDRQLLQASVRDMLLVDQDPRALARTLAGLPERPDTFRANLAAS